MKNIKLLFVVFTIVLASCSSEPKKQIPSNEELAKVEVYKNEKTHDENLVGVWVFDGTYETFSETGKIHLALRENGLYQMRNYVDGVAKGDWSTNYYYYTEDSKIYLFRPSSAGLFSVNEAVEMVHTYSVSEDGKALTIKESEEYDSVYLRLEE